MNYYTLQITQENSGNSASSNEAHDSGDVKLFFLTTGSVTAMDLYGLIDQDAYIYSVLLTGHQLKKMLNISINSINNSNSTDFLHVSGK
jgi:hypothetical protein